MNVEKITLDRQLTPLHKDLLLTYLKICISSNKSPKTIESYLLDLTRFLLWCQHLGRSAEQIGGQDIHLYKAHLESGKLPPPKRSWLDGLFGKKKLPPALPGRADEGLAVGSRVRHLSSLKNFYEFLVQSEGKQYKRFKNNPVKSKIHAIRLKDSDVEHTVLLTPEDYRAIMNVAIRMREKLMVEILYIGGLRIAELAQLKFSDFNQSQGSVNLIRKGGYRHKLYLQKPKRLLEYLHKHQNRTPGEFLFPGRKPGTHLTTRAIYGQLKKLFIKAGVDPKGLSPHSFRKGCATELYKKKKDLLYVRDYLNHKDAKVTQTYIDTGREEE